MYITSYERRNKGDAGDTLFGTNPRRKDKTLLLDITIVNSYVSTNLDSAVRQTGKYLIDAVEWCSKYRARSPLPTPSFLLLCPRMVSLTETCILLSRRCPPDEWNTAQRKTPEESRHLAEGTEKRVSGVFFKCLS